MNILVVSDGFSKGGLETHINTYYNYLSKSNNVIFAFGNYVSGNYLKGANIIDGFHFSSCSTIRDFQDDVKDLVKIIEENKIDIIQVHPFYCLFPSLVAANITSTKIVFTAHGRVSLNFFSSANDTILYKFAVEEMLNAIFCVSKSGEEWLKLYAKSKVHYLPNLINFDDYEEHKVVNNKKWALISRLDADKKAEIIKFLQILDKLDIESLDIYGEGSLEKEIKKFVKSNNLEDKVTFMGYESNINKALNGKYNGVLGLGRVALEALAMNYPTILIGYGKIAGLIDATVYEKIKDVNFVPTEVEEVSLEKLQSQLKNLDKKCRFRVRVMSDFSVRRLDDYLDIIKDCTFSSIDSLKVWYEGIDKIKDKKQLFYTSLDVLNLLVQHIVPYCSDLELKAIVNSFNKINEMNTIINQKLLDTNQKLLEINQKVNEDLSGFKNEIESLKSYISSLEQRVVVTENTGLTTLVKRAAKNAVKRNK